MLSELHSVAPNVISIRSDWDIIVARMAARDMARKLGFTTIDQARIATATSELARNIVTYAGEGNVTIGRVQQGNRHGIELVFADHGPGIGTMNRALQDNLKPRSSKGLGLAASRRLMDDLDITTNTDGSSGTTITCRKWLR